MLDFHNSALNAKGYKVYESVVDRLFLKHEDMITGDQMELTEKASNLSSITEIQCDESNMCDPEIGKLSFSLEGGIQRIC